MCPAGRWRPLYIPLHILTVYSVTADQTITAPHPDHPRPLLLCSRMDLIFSCSASSECDGRPIKCGLCVPTCLLSGPLGCLVSVCPHSSAADSHTVLQNVKRLFSKTCESYAEFESSEDVETCSSVRAWNPCYAKHTPLKSKYLSLTLPLF